MWPQWRPNVTYCQAEAASLRVPGKAEGSMEIWEHLRLRSKWDSIPNVALMGQGLTALSDAVEEPKDCPYPVPEYIFLIQM